jgi:hypothetical protein
MPGRLRVAAHITDDPQTDDPQTGDPQTGDPQTDEGLGVSSFSSLESTSVGMCPSAHRWAKMS